MYVGGESPAAGDRVVYDAINYPVLASHAWSYIDPVSRMLFHHTVMSGDKGIVMKPYVNGTIDVRMDAQPTLILDQISSSLFSLSISPPSQRLLVNQLIDTHASPTSVRACSCSVDELMRYGCHCGSIRRYVQPWQRRPAQP